MEMSQMQVRQMDMMQQYIMRPPVAPQMPGMMPPPQPFAGPVESPRPTPSQFTPPPGMDPDLAAVTQSLLQILQPQLDGLRAEVSSVNQSVAVQQQMEQRRLQQQQESAFRQQGEQLVQSLSKPTADGQPAVAPVFANPQWGFTAIRDFNEAWGRERWRNPADVAREVQQTYDMRITQTVQQHVQPGQSTQAFTQPGARVPVAPTAGSGGGPLIVLPEPRDTRDVASQARTLRAHGAAIPPVA